MKKLTDLRPCDSCDGPVGLLFYTLRISLTVVNRQAVHEYLGMAQFFGGRAGSALIENFAPAAASAITVAGDEHHELMTELAICQRCYLDAPLDLALLVEQRRVAIERATVKEGPMDDPAAYREENAAEERAIDEQSPTNPQADGNDGATAPASDAPAESEADSER